MESLGIEREPQLITFLSEKENMKQFLTNEDGLETVEYAIIVSLIVAGLLAVVAGIGAWAKGEFDALSTELGA